MKVLIAAPEIPYPPTHGGARLKLYQLLKCLSERHELTLFALVESEEERGYVKHLEPYCQAIRVFDRPDYFRRGAVREYLRAPYWRLYYSAVMERAVGEELTRERYDLVHVDTGFIAMLVRAIPNDLPRLMAAHDSLTAVRFSMAKHAPNLTARLKETWWALLVRQFEREFYPQYDGCVVVAQPDVDVLHKLCPNLPLRLVPSGVDTDFFVPKPEIEVCEELVFTGTMDYGPNVDAATHFVRDILPRIREKLPAARFSIVGRSPSANVKALGDADGVNVIGYVPDLRTHVQRASVYVCPLRQGAGMKNKMLEAMAMGKAIVATHSAASGLAAVDGRELLIRDDDEGFAESVLSLMNDTAARRRLGDTARRYVLAHHSWETTGQLMDEAYARTVGSRRGPTKREAIGA